MSCYSPFMVEDKITNIKQPVPCGKCPPCCTRRASGWSFRLMQEEKRSTSAQFITLTYDTQYVPITKNGFMSLDKTDVQKFFKKLRKHEKNKRNKISYYYVGEYGGKTRRPHYHIILFNAELSTIQACWTLGNVHYGTVNGASVGYTLKYISKPHWRPMHQNDDRAPQFANMSKGLGSNYLTPSMIKWHHKDPFNRMLINLEGGKIAAMPRYYKNKIYSEEKRKAIGFHQRIEMIKREAEIQNDPIALQQREASKIAAFLKQKTKANKADKL